MPRQSRRLLLRSGLLLAGLGLLAGCRQPVPPAGAVQGKTSATATRPPAKAVRIGVLWADTPGDLHAAFAQGLVEQGRREGPSLVIETHWVRSRTDLLPAAAADLVRIGVDLIVAPSTPAALAARQSTGTIPIVMVATGDPIADGLVGSLTRPGGNVTGLSSFLSGSEPGTPRPAAGGVPGHHPRRHPLERGRPRQVPRGRPDTGRRPGVWPHRPAPAHPHIRRHRERAHDDAVRADRRACRPGGRRDPFVAAPDRGFCEAAAPADHLRSPRVLRRRRGADGVRPSFPDLFRRSTGYVDRILKGARPADLPVEQPTTADFTVNLPVAQALGQAILPPLLARATVVLT